MARVKGAMMTRKRRKKVLKLAKGYWGSKSRHFKMAKQAVMKCPRSPLPILPLLPLWWKRQRLLCKEEIRA